MTSTKKIIIISPIVLYPIKGGGATRILQMVSFLKSNGYDVTLISVDPHVNKGFLEKYADQVVLHPNPIKRKSSSFLMRQVCEDFNEVIKLVVSKINPIAIIGNFAWMAESFIDLPDNILKIIDAHDVQHQRSSNAEKNGGDLSSRFCTYEEEAYFLNMTDVIISIEDSEKSIFEEMAPDKKVITIKFAVDDIREYVQFNSQNLLFIGANYDPNCLGLKKFIHTSWDRLRVKYPNITLHICGSVGDCIEEDDLKEGIVVEGFVDSLEAYYKQASLVINPCLYGSGLPIKTVEALSFGRCVVASKSGARGIDTNECPAVIKCDYELMVDAIADLLDDIDLRESKISESQKYLNGQFSREAVYKELVNVIDLHNLSLSDVVEYDSSIAPSVIQRGKIRVKALFKKLLKI